MTATAHQVGADELVYQIYHYETSRHEHTYYAVTALGTVKVHIKQDPYTGSINTWTDCLLVPHAPTDLTTQVSELVHSLHSSRMTS